MVDYEPKRHQQVVFMLKYLNERAGELAQNDLDWAIKMEEAFTEQKGSLSDKQFRTLQSIFKRY